MRGANLPTYMKLKKLIVIPLFYAVSAMSADSYDIRLFVEGVRAHQSEETPDIDPAQKPNPDEWLSFFLEKATAFPSSFTNMSDWRSGKYTINLASKSLNNTNIPTGTFGVDDIYIIDLTSNNFTDIDFLRGVKSAEKIDLKYSKSLKNVNGLIDLNSVGTLVLSAYDTNQRSISDISGLRNLKYANNINIGSQSNITDFSPLQNISGTNGASLISISIHNNPYYNKSFDQDSPICNALRKGIVRIHASFRIGNDGRGVFTSQAGSMCKSNDPWIQMLNSRSDSHWGTLLKSSDLPDPYGPAKAGSVLNIANYDAFVSGLLTESELPESQLPERFSGFELINLSYFGIKHLNILKGLNKITNIKIYNGNLVDISALSKFTSAKDLSIISDKITSLNGLENLKSVNNLTIKLSAPSVDLTPISNITTAKTVILKKLYNVTYKYPSKDSPYCQSSSTPDFTMEDSAGGKSIVPKSSVCL